MSTHVVTCQFKRDPGTEHLTSTSVEVDAVAVLFSWTDHEGRGYEVVLRESDRLVATLQCDHREQAAATEDLNRHCSALGLTRETVAPFHAQSPATAAGSHVPKESFMQGVHHGR